MYARSENENNNVGAKKTKNKNKMITKTHQAIGQSERRKVYPGNENDN